MSHQSPDHAPSSRHHHPYVTSEHPDDAALAELLDLDAQVFGGYLDELTEWAGRYALTDPRTVVDVGAGTGTGTVALARRFPAAQVLALDRSASMLERVAGAAGARGMDHRVRLVHADVDVAWPVVGAVDVVWAASSLHELADADRLLREVHDALERGGLLVVVEMDALPRFLPDDLGLGRPGLEQRCHEALARAGWNAHPDWHPNLERAGFEVVAQQAFPVEAHPAPGTATRYAYAWVRRMRSALEGRLGSGDLETLDQLLAEEPPHGRLSRLDLKVRSSRTAWAARRP